MTIAGSSPKSGFRVDPAHPGFQGLQSPLRIRPKNPSGIARNEPHESAGGSRNQKTVAHKLPHAFHTGGSTDFRSGVTRSQGGDEGDHSAARVGRVPGLSAGAGGSNPAWVTPRGELGAEGNRMAPANRVQASRKACAKGFEGFVAGGVGAWGGQTYWTLNGVSPSPRCTPIAGLDANPRLRAGDDVNASPGQAEPAWQPGETWDAPTTRTSAGWGDRAQVQVGRHGGIRISPEAGQRRSLAGCGVLPRSVMTGRLPGGGRRRRGRSFHPWVFRPASRMPSTGMRTICPPTVIRHQLIRIVHREGTHHLTGLFACLHRDDALAAAALGPVFLEIVRLPMPLPPATSSMARWVPPKHRRRRRPTLNSDALHPWLRRPIERTCSSGKRMLIPGNQHQFRSDRWSGALRRGRRRVRG